MQTVDEKALRETTNAAVWASEFCKVFSIFTEEGVIQDAEGLMLGWFANAIERGRDAGREEGRIEASAQFGAVPPPEKDS